MKQMSPIKAIAFFNNKGGVGKTTLACNFASWLSREHGKRVVVIDCDPQANATQLSLTDDLWDSIYEDVNKSRKQTLLHVFKDINDGYATICKDYKLHNAERFSYSVLAAHPNLATIEDTLSSSWVEFLGAKSAGANRTTWLRSLCTDLNTQHEFEYAIIDMGPSLGALNRSILLGCDAFITPVEPSLFSQYALLNIGTWVTNIINDYDRSRQETLKKNPDLGFIDKLPENLPLTEGWIGYTIQQYLVKRKDGKERQVQNYEYYKQKIADSSKTLLRLLPCDSLNGEIGTVPYMFSMAPLAQAKHTPIACLRPADGLIGAQAKQRDKYVTQLELIFNEIFDRISQVHN
jgi:cobyrinic acid ac-diamide synthase